MAARKIKLTHPGKILREEFMEPVGLSAHALAKALDVPLPRVNDIVREKRSILTLRRTDPRAGDCQRVQLQVRPGSCWC